LAYPDTTHLAFIGLGQMGRPMALNLCRKAEGATLTVMSASGRHHAEFTTLGARTATAVAELVGAQVAFLCLPDEAAVREVTLGTAGLEAVLAPGSLVIDTARSRPPPPSKSRPRSPGAASRSWMRRSPECKPGRSTAR